MPIILVVVFHNIWKILAEWFRGVARLDFVMQLINNAKLKSKNKHLTSCMCRTKYGTPLVAFE